MRYRVEHDGTLRFAGGLKAVSKEYVWSGSMTDEDVQAFLDLLEVGGWRDREPTSTGVPADLIHQIALNWPNGRARYEVKGTSDSIAAMHALLDGIAGRRLAVELDRLPQASIQKHIEQSEQDASDNGG